MKVSPRRWLFCFLLSSLAEDTCYTLYTAHLVDGLCQSQRAWRSFWLQLITRGAARLELRRLPGVRCSIPPGGHARWPRLGAVSGGAAGTTQPPPASEFYLT